MKEYEEMQKHRQQTKEAIDQLDQRFRELRTAMIDYKDGIRSALYMPPLTMLAELMVNMERAKDVFAGQLENILYSFGMQTIAPAAGDIFDYDRHLRYRSDEVGETVRQCVSRGWMLDNSVLVPAVVVTSEPPAQNNPASARPDTTNLSQPTAAAEEPANPTEREEMNQYAE